MNTVPVTWREFREHLLAFAQQDLRRRGQVLFRGHGSTAWPLKTTLDRTYAFPDDVSRLNGVQELLAEFSREAVTLPAVQSTLPDGAALELVGRHHGLPSPLLDWTESPYIASYFAYDNCRGPEPACVWMLDRAVLPATAATPADFNLVDDRALLRFNRRALQQRGVFLRVNTVREPLEDLLSAALTRFDLPSAERRLALAELDVMNVNAGVLFQDLDGVARTVQARMP